MKYSKEEKIFITKKYAIFHSITLVQRAWRSKFKNYRPPNRSTILDLVRKFDKLGSIDNMNGRNINISHKRKDAKILLERVVSEKTDLSLSEAAKVADISFCLARLVLK